MKTSSIQMGRNWGWFLAAGIAFCLAGLAAFLWPVASTLSLAFALGVFFTVGGAIALIQAFRLRGESGNGWRAFHGIAALVAGILMLRYPAGGMLGVAIAMTFYFLVSAAAKGVIALGMRPEQGWGWAMASAVASLCLGIYMIATFPVSALWVPGFLLGLDFAVHGSSLIGFSLTLRKARHLLQQSTTPPPDLRRVA